MNIKITTTGSMKLKTGEAYEKPYLDIICMAGTIYMGIVPFSSLILHMCLEKNKNLAC
jgi:hypothetical protein